MIGDMGMEAKDIAAEHHAHSTSGSLFSHPPSIRPIFRRIS